MSVQANILKLFKVMVIEDHQRCDPEVHASGICGKKNVVTDFIPSATQQLFLDEQFKPIDIKTLFSWEERTQGSFWDLLYKQLTHYYEVYGLDQPGLFDLEVPGGYIVPMTFVKGVNEYELGNLVRKLIYSNAPIKDSAAVIEIIRHYSIPYSINLVKNNEVRVMLFNPDFDILTSGDDFVRWVCWKATKKPLLIKDKTTIAAVKSMPDPPSDYLLLSHASELARVFLRHKPLILAMKRKSTVWTINHISRLAKSGYHQPLPPSANKTFIADYLAGRVGSSTLANVSLRDKMKYLNIVAEKKANLTNNAFIIRNGKVWVQPNSGADDQVRLDALEQAVLSSIENDLLTHLQGKTIVLPRDIDYGLPTSRKQTVGNLPFGTRIIVGDNISSGVYWENAGGASDLDLSTVDISGQRTGWGGGRGYTADDIIFSGDITSAPAGAMEFMTNNQRNVPTYGLFVNVFTGELPCKMKLVVGTRSPHNNKWIDDCAIMEEHTLESKGNLLGFVKQNHFVVYAGRLNNATISGPRDTAVVEKANVNYWTVSQLLASCGIPYRTSARPDVVVDHDLSYSGFTYDKLEALLNLN